MIISRKYPVRLVSIADVESLAAVIILKSNALVIDERTTRLLVEDIDRIKKIMQRKLRTKITINNKNERELKRLLKDIKVIRSFEIVIVAYKLGLLNKYLPNPNAKKLLLDSLLWGVKTDGCAVSEKEIRQVIKTES